MKKKNINNRQPALTPALLAIQAKLQQEAIAPKSGQFERLSLWKASSIAIFGIYSLSGWNILAFAISAIELLGLLSVYTTLLSKPATSSNAVLSADMHVHLRQLAPRVAGTMLVALALQTLFLGFIPFSIVTMLLTSLSKAFTWFFMMELVCEKEVKPKFCFALIIVGSKYFMGCSYCCQNVQHFCYSQPLHTIF